MTGFIPGLRSFNTRCFATVYRFDRDALPLNGNQTTGRGRGGPLALVSCTTDKQLGAASGNFTLGVKEGTLDLQEEILPGDWVVIHWTRNGKAIPGMLGRVTNVGRARRSKDGVTVEDWTISGSDFGQIFEQTPVWFDDFTNLPANVGGQVMGQRMGFNPAGSPDQLVAAITLAWLGSGDSPRGLLGGSWRWPASLNRLGDFFTEGLHMSVNNGQPKLMRVSAEGPHLRGVSGNLNLFTPKQGSVLQDVLVEWSHPILNELYYDIAVDVPRTDAGDGALFTPEEPVPVVFVRERPFINLDAGLDSPWFKLPTVRLPRDGFTTSNVSKSDRERLNLFLLYAAGWGMANHAQYAVWPPAYSRDEIARHGLRKWEKQTRFVFPTPGKSWVEELGEWHRLVTSWYGPNHLWLNGNIDVPYVVPEARVGHRLVIGDDNDIKREQFYIEGVSTSWRYPGRGSTQIQLTRGFRGEDSVGVDLVSTIANSFRRAFTRSEAEIDFSVSPGNVSIAPVEGFAVTPGDIVISAEPPRGGDTKID